MIILDFNQIIISGIIEYNSLDNSKEYYVDEDFVRHLILNYVKYYIRRFKYKFGPTVVLASDNRHYWRKDLFPYYKAGRKKIRNDSNINWESLFEYMKIIKAEMTEYFPHRVLEVDKCEADDVIFVLVNEFAINEKIVIVSSDKDFGQLHRYKNVKQFSPMKRDFIRVDSPDFHLKELIIRGDKSDGIPNILSPDDTFVSGGRQKPIMKVKLEKWLTLKPEEFCDENMLRNYNRNSSLIDLSKIPHTYYNNIVESFDKYKMNSKEKFYNYLLKNNLRKIILEIGDF